MRFKKKIMIHYYESRSACRDTRRVFGQTIPVILRRAAWGRTDTHYANLSFNLVAPPVRLLFSFGEGGSYPPTNAGIQSESVQACYLLWRT